MSEQKFSISHNGLINAMALGLYIVFKTNLKKQDHVHKKKFCSYAPHNRRIF